MPNALDLTGKRFGRLIVLEFAGTQRSKSGSSKRYWKCKCDCGNEKIIHSSALMNGNTTSCGCFNKEILKTGDLRRTHGKTKTRLYKIWIDMKRRCYDEWRKSFKYYGGKGIKVCDEWFNNFEGFENWAIKNGYSDGLTIDRIDTSKDYSPENCRWVTRKVQANNRTSNMIVTMNGKTQTLKEWTTELNVNYGTVNSRINRLHWSVEDALTVPPHKKRGA